MKLKTLLSALCILFSSTVYADSLEQEKINFVKKVYEDQLNEDLMGVDVLKLHASKELRLLIQKRDAIADLHEGEMCGWVRQVLIPGNDHDVRANKIKYSVLSNGLVRAQAKNFGESFHVDLDIKCDAQGCKITDIYDPGSYKKELISIVKNGTC
ncbi:hypothetical protein [Acinetobacter brisouii]|uniref:Uncharacterized protein n=1 Tax=Acinetobacter brisouii CIP 110357 TaxID=1341683 RepID=V2UCD6_9GAMM|nr:hypothetical protein [Acinetobacter brisouii]ENV48772.1 hypothetical protein F954_00162 [Acinetobacter brisouii ANC 4119]ESK48187.1 hypothetical protein P255_02830 [Acinetobacter brisouii CIP 110357]